MQRHQSGIEPVRPQPGRPDGEPPKPLLSIGLAVYNGSEHLREAIDSLLAQDVDDLELVISDNASTDETPEICLDYARRDSRVSYSRNAENIGAAANFNKVFEMCSGEYFMWGSDDDIGTRDLHDRASRSWSAHPGQCIAPLTSSSLRRAVTRYPICPTGALTPTECRSRPGWHELIARTGWFGIYGVIRPSALRATNRFVPVFGGDVRLLLELTLLGDLLSVPEPLFRYRFLETAKSATEYVDELGSRAINTEKMEQTSEPYGFLARELLSVVADSTLDARTVGRIEDDFIETLTIENLDWGRRILRERGLSLDELRATGAASKEMSHALGLDSTPRFLAAVAPSYSQPWAIRKGMGLTFLRRMLLRLLQPFTDKQSAMDAESTRALEILTREAVWLRRRVQALERLNAENDERS